MGLALNRVHQGDARLLAPKLRDRTIAVTVTSPPYWRLKDYGVPDQIGWGQQYAEYLRDLVSIFRHVHRATRDSGSLWLVLDTLKWNGRLKLLPFDLALRLQRDAGWILRDLIVWNKEKTLPWSRKGQLRNQFEYILCFSKRMDFKYEIDRLKEIELKEWWVRFPERYNPRGKVPSNIWTLPIPVQGSWSSNGLHHACPFPISLVERIIRLTTDPQPTQVVFDPFAGSGIVLAVAKQMGRGFLGFELNQKYITMYRTTVCGFVQDEWTSRRKEMNAVRARRRILRRQILKLRVTKYPRTLVTELRKALPPASPTFFGAIVLASKQRPSKPYHLLTIKVILIADTRHREALKVALQRVTSAPPLSKFGLDANVNVVSLDGVRDLLRQLGISVRRRVAIYEDGRTYKYHDATTLHRWLESLSPSPNGDSPRFPPIAASILVAQKIRHTWLPKNSLNGSLS